MKNNILAVIAIIGISVSALADTNTTLEITLVENCRTYVSHENPYKIRDPYEVQTFYKNKNGSSIVRLSNHGIYRLYNFGYAPECSAPDGNKITIRLNGAEPIEVKIPMNHVSHELVLSIGVDMQDSYEIKPF